VIDSVCRHAFALSILAHQGRGQGVRGPDGRAGQRQRPEQVSYSHFMQFVGCSTG